MRAARVRAPASKPKEKHMSGFRVGDIVQAMGSRMTGNVGTVIWIDEKRGRYLVLISPQTQNYFTADELRLYR